MGSSSKQREQGSPQKKCFARKDRELAAQTGRASNGGTKPARDDALGGRSGKGLKRARRISVHCVERRWSVQGKGGLWREKKTSRRGGDLVARAKSIT